MSITREEQARRAQYLTGLMWHVGAFLIINAFFWVLDLLVGQSGIQWAYWITLFWGFALAFHVLAYLVVGRRSDGTAHSGPLPR
jgi:2TM domain